MSHPSGCRCDGKLERAKRLGGCLRLDCPANLKWNHGRFSPLNCFEKLLKDKNLI